MTIAADANYDDVFGSNNSIHDSQDDCRGNSEVNGIDDSTDSHDGDDDSKS